MSDRRRRRMHYRRRRRWMTSRGSAMRSFRRRLLTATAFTAATVLVSALATATTATAGGDVNALLAESLRQAVVAQDFKDVLDLTPPEQAAASSKAGAPEKYDPLSAEE